MMEVYEEIAGGLAAHNRRNSGRTRPEDVRSAVIALRSGQFVFESRSPGHFALLKSMRSSLEPHFELSGCRMIVDDAEGFVALAPLDEVPRLALTVEETLVLLTLRWLYETKAELREVETDGTVRVEEAELQQWYEKLSQRAWPKRAVVKAAIDLFERRGMLTVALDDDESMVMSVSGVVRIVTGDGYVGRLRAFLEAARAKASDRAVDEAALERDDASPSSLERIEGDVE
jgi:hypothetical protein